MSAATILIANWVDDCGEAFLRRLLSAYGSVIDVKIQQYAGSSTSPTTSTDGNMSNSMINHEHNMYKSHSYRYCLATYESCDDADCAIAALHLRYCTAPGIPLVVLYAKESPHVSEYGRAVGAHYRVSIEQNQRPVPIPLESFDSRLVRGVVYGPPNDFSVPYS